MADIKKFSVNNAEKDIQLPIDIADNRFSDLEISDEYGNVIVDFKNGHINTKHFSSSATPICQTNEISDADLNITDENNNTLVSFKNGHIYTKNFNSESINNLYTDKFRNKTIGIIGDSISTFTGWLPSDVYGYNGSAYACYYSSSNLANVKDTWWWKVCDMLGIDQNNQLNNCSWSGSMVSGDSASTTNAYAACSEKRISDLNIRGFIPDIIICYISCNDWANNVPIGTWTLKDPIPNGVVNELRGAYALMLNKLHITYPKSRIFCCTNLDDFSRDKIAGWPSDNTSGVTTYEWNQNIIEIAHIFGCDVINLHRCGINYSNIKQYYAVDTSLHPNDAGHTLIANKVVTELIAKY